MGMYDYLTCNYPLPVKGANACHFQTKDTPNQGLDHYEICEKGKLWLLEIGGDPKLVPFTGDILFYDFWDPSDINVVNTEYDRWIEFRASFINGRLKDLKLISKSP